VFDDEEIKIYAGWKIKIERTRTTFDKQKKMTQVDFDTKILV
jgi:hypothetical protein